MAAVAAAPLACAAQGEPDWLVDTLYGGGKINTVLAVVALILTGIAWWLTRLDRRISRMEKQQRTP